MLHKPATPESIIENMRLFEAKYNTYFKAYITKIKDKDPINKQVVAYQALSVQIEQYKTEIHNLFSQGQKTELINLNNEYHRMLLDIMKPEKDDINKVMIDISKKKINEILTGELIQKQDYMKRYKFNIDEIKKLIQNSNKNLYEKMKELMTTQIINMMDRSFGQLKIDTNIKKQGLTKSLLRRFRKPRSQEQSQKKKKEKVGDID